MFEYIFFPSSDNLNFRDSQTLKLKSPAPPHTKKQTKKRLVYDTERSDSSEFETVVDTELPHWLT